MIATSHARFIDHDFAVVAIVIVVVRDLLSGVLLVPAVLKRCIVRDVASEW